MDVDVVVLAGGAGERMGGVDKAALEVGGVRLLDRVLLAAAAAQRIVVVGAVRPIGPAVSVALACPVGWTLEEPAGGGPLAGLAAGVAQLEAHPDDDEDTAGSPAGTGPRPRQGRAVLVLATDLPRLTARDVERLTAALDEAGPATDGAIFVDAAGRAQPLAAIYRRDPLVRALAREHPVSGRPVRVLLAGLVLVSVPDSGAAADCDTAEQLASARAAVELPNTGTRSGSRGSRESG